jgi:MFS family permease
VLATGLLLPMSVTVGAGSLASGPLTARLGPRPPMIAGLTLGAAGAALLAAAGTATSLPLILAGSILRVPLLVAMAGYLVATALALFTIRGDGSRRAAS